MNFGGLGMILAHEYGHSFDIIGWYLVLSFTVGTKHGSEKN